jgi:hypothetical protein
VTKERGPFRVIGWGPFRMPGEKRRMAALHEKYDQGESCIETASCEEGDHTYTWPCDLAPGTGSEAGDE